MSTRTAVSILVIASTTALVSVLASYLYRKQRAQWQEEEEAKGAALHSIIEHFKHLHLEPETTVEEASE